MKRSNRYFFVSMSLIGLLSVNVHAQSQKYDRATDSLNMVRILLNNEKNVLRNASLYQDYAVVLRSLYTLMELDQNKRMWKDSICITYFKTGAYRQCLAIASELLQDRPSDQRLMAIIAFSEKSSGQIKEALETYEKLYPLSGDLYDLYEIASLQFSLKRFGECESSINKLINSPESKEQTILLSYESQKQLIPVKAAALNLKGAIMQELNKKQEAIHYFEEALKITPEFMLARKNLQLVSK
jgi:tetratricopeptide (TPR) repeat protein